jgi:transcriptional regulator with XRE-family HTH domain
MRVPKIDLENTLPCERLLYIRNLLRLSRRYIEEKYNLPEATLKAWENNKARLTEKGLNRCIDIYRQEGVLVNSEWINTGKGLSPRISVDMGKYLASDFQYPQHETSQINDSSTSYSIDDSKAILREATFFKESAQNVVVLMVTDNDMNPVYQIGDYVGGLFRYGKDIDSAVKRDCIIRLKDGALVIRRLFKSKHNNLYNLACINPATESDNPILFSVAIESAAPIIWHRIPNV